MTEKRKSRDFGGELCN